MSIFLSYSHHDEKDPENWVSKFHTKLRTRLETLTGEDIRILFDRYDHQGNLLEEGIDEMIEKSQLLIALVSPSYLKRDWCTKERDTFLETIKNKGTKSIKPEERLIVAIKLLEYGHKEVSGEFIESLPDGLRKQRYFQFFTLDKNGNPTTIKPDENNFDIEINDLAYKLVSFLKKIQNQKEEKKSIFLAETSRDLESKRKELAKELELSGYEVYPTNLLPDSKDEISNEVNHYLRKSMLSVHLIGGHYGFKIPDTEDSITKFQYRLAVSTERPMLTWMSRDLKILDQDQLLFIESLKTVPSNNDLVQSSFEDFKQDLFERIKEIKNEL